MAVPRGTTRKMKLNSHACLLAELASSVVDGMGIKQATRKKGMRDGGLRYIPGIGDLRRTPSGTRWSHLWA